MKNIRKSLFFLIFLTSCYTTKVTPIQDVMNSWLGASEQDITLKFGPPTRTTSDGASGKIYIYENTRTLTSFYPSYNRYLPDQAISNSVTKYINFYFNSNGKVYYWRTNYPDEKKSTFSPSKTAWTVIGGITGSAAFIYLCILLGTAL